MKTTKKPKREPRVWHKDDKDLPADAVYVGRPSKWGNPWSDKPSRIDPSVVLVKSRFKAIENYYEWFHGETKLAEQFRRECRAELRGKDLVCWCKPEDCHADILLDYANGDD